MRMLSAALGMRMHRLTAAETAIRQLRRLKSGKNREFSFFRQVFGPKVKNPNKKFNFLFFVLNVGSF